MRKRYFSTKAQDVVSDSEYHRRNNNKGIHRYIWSILYHKVQQNMWKAPLLVHEIRKKEGRSSYWSMRDWFSTDVQVMQIWVVIYKREMSCEIA